MSKGRPRRRVVLSEKDRLQLSAVVRSHSLDHGVVRRAHVALLAADGLSNDAIAEKLGLSQQSVCLWRKRFIEGGIQGLPDEMRPGRPRSVSDEQVALLVRKTLDTAPKDDTHWSLRSIAKATRLSHETVHRIWRAFGLQPHRQRHFKLSTDPCFVEKVRDIVGLYLPARRMWLSCVSMKRARSRPSSGHSLCYR